MLFDEEKLYEQIVSDICDNEYPKYDNLAIFLYSLLKDKVKGWCKSSAILYGGMHYEDIVQGIQIRIIKNCDGYFFRPNGEKADKSCKDFKAWCSRVAKNYFLTYCAKQKNKKEIITDFTDADERKIEDKKGIDDNLNNEEKIKHCRAQLTRSFEVVFDLKSSPHIILTWLSVSLFMLNTDNNKIDSTHMIVDTFSNVSLFDMFDFIIAAIRKTGWINLSEEQIDKQRQNLESISKNTGKKIGEMRYEEFYMSKGSEKSISDWMNRINSQIKKQLN